MPEVDLSGDTLGSDRKEYRLKTYLTGGAFGQIYIGEDLKHPERGYVAIKTESKNSPNPQLSYEYERYKNLHGKVGFPDLYYIGQLVKHPDFHGVVLQLLGKSLAELHEKLKRFSEPTLLQIACQCISRLKQLHDSGYIYRDIKPQNFCIGREKHHKTIYLIDMGLTKPYEYLDKESGKRIHIPHQQENNILGTARYMSINANTGQTQGRRDDLEALAYMLAHLGVGTLPWIDIKQEGQNMTAVRTYYEKLAETKKNTIPEHLFKGYDPAFSVFYREVRKLKHEDKPNYNGYISAFCRVLYTKYKQYIDIFDWESKT